MKLNLISFCLALAMLSLCVSIVSDNAEAVPTGVLPEPLDDASVEARKTLTWHSWSENKTYSASYLKEGGVLLDKISFHSSKANRAVVVFVHKLLKRPALISSDPPGDSYAFLQVSLNRAAAESADRMTLYFAVEDRWLEFNTLNKSSVRLMAYDQGAKSWIALDTEFENGTFSASAPPNYSIFSIAALSLRSQQGMIEKTEEEKTPSNGKQDTQRTGKQTPEPSQESLSDTTENKSENELTNTPEMEEVEELPAEPEEKSVKVIIISAILLFILGIALVIFGAVRWKKDRPLKP